MKVDKDALVKHRFWVGLGAFTLLWLIILMVALFSAGSKAAENATKLKKQKDDVTNQKDIKNEKFTSLVTEKKQELEKQKDQVWKQAWLGQTNMMFWPHPQRRPEVWERLEREGYFGEEIAPGERSDYKNDGVYDSQLPVQGEGGLRDALWPVQAKGGDWNLLIRRATFDPHNIPTNEEMWLAQEDLWVQRELLGIVKDALESARWFENVANFKRVEIPKAEQEQPAAPATGGTPSGAEEAKKPVVQRQRFRNPQWQLDLVTEQGEKGLTATTQTTLKCLDPERAAKPVAGLSLLVGQLMEPTPKAQLLAFEGKPDGKGLLTLKAAVPLPGFSADFERLPFVVTLAGDKDDPPPAAPTQRFRFRSPDWEMELILERAPDGQYVVSGKSKLKNVNVSKRTLALNLAKFTVLCGGREVTEITIPEDWLPAGSTAEIKQASRPFVYDAGKPIAVRQDFTWATSPIKRVDAIEFPGSASYNSHRTANLALKPAAQFPLPKAEEAAAPAGQAGAMGGMAGGPKGEMGRGGATDVSKTPNGLIRERYISVTDQVRHMPVALDLIVDQAHMQDVLTAVVNSRLRIQITQVQWRRIRGVKSTGDEAGPGTAGGMAPPGVPGGLGGPPSGFGGPPGTPGAPGSFGGPPTGSGRYGGGMSPGPGGGSSGSGMPPVGGPGVGGLRSPGGSSPGSSGGLPPVGPGGRGPGTPGVGAGDDSDPNLVELAVYGIAALYERYPPKSKDAAAAAPGAPAANAAPPAAK
jgi:hypothetical protein